MEIGIKIRKLRQEKGIKQEELVAFLNISQSQLSKIENGTSFVTFEQVINISNYLKTSLFEFLPKEIELLQQIDLRTQLEELHKELKMHKETIVILQNRIRNLEEGIS